MANGVTHMMQSWRVTSTLGSPYKQCHISTGGYPCVAPETVLVCFHDLWPTQEIDLATCNHWILWQNTMLSSRLLYQWHLQPPWWSAPVGNTKLSAKYVKVIFDRAANKNHVNAAKALQFARRVQKPWLTIHFGHNGWMLCLHQFLEFTQTDWKSYAAKQWSGRNCRFLKQQNQCIQHRINSCINVYI